MHRLSMDGDHEEGKKEVPRKKKNIIFYYHPQPNEDN